MSLETSNQETNFELGGPWPDGKISVRRKGEGLVAAKLEWNGRWQHAEQNRTYCDPETKECIVDIRTAIEAANEMFPGGPQLLNK